MKKIDKLVLVSFIGPFAMTFLVVVFILLSRHMLLYFDDIIGKDLGWLVLSELLFYFSVFMIPIAMPLAVLLSSLMTFGNLAEHFELTAIKSAGISLLRTILPIFGFVAFLSVFNLYLNNHVVPKAALEAFSLMYDIKQKKPALDIVEGTFYTGIPDISIKVNRKLPDGITLKDVVLYDHSKNNGNKQVIVAASGRMSTILNQRYLKFELFDGYSYSEDASDQREIGGKSSIDATLSRTQFIKYQVVYDLSSFILTHTSKLAFQNNRLMRNLTELNNDIDSLARKIHQQELDQLSGADTYLTYFAGGVLAPPARSRREPNLDTVVPRDTTQQPRIDHVEETWRLTDSTSPVTAEGLYRIQAPRAVREAATNRARHVKNQLSVSNLAFDNDITQKIVFEVQWHKIIANSFMCIVMFLIGAPLGAIIKRGGLGAPFLVSIAFFVTYYVLNIQCENLAAQKIVSPWAAVWIPPSIFLCVGFALLREARVDSRLFEADAYRILVDRLREWLIKRRSGSNKE
jgi:lipopolysaccharide export system permease protein